MGRKKTATPKSTTVQPTDVEHIVGDDEFFFSTTDRKGIIEQANSVFVRLSRYDHDTLAGAPHNLIRHPDMPGGAFKLVWDQIESGRPACAYVRNMAADGGTYWVFATLLPVGDKYLSVRMSPMVTALKDASATLYTRVRPAELGARESDGATRDEAAALGLGLLVEGLAGLGITSADDLALVALPQEVAAHERVGGLPYRPDATGRYADLLEVMHRIDRETAAVVSQLDEFDALVTALGESAQDAGPAVDRLTRIVEAVEAAPRQDDVPEMLPVFAERIVDLATSAVDRMSDLDGYLTSLAAEVRRLRMRIALLRLHNRMIGTFCAEIIDGTTSFDADAALPLLAQALEEGARELNETFTHVRDELQAVPVLIRDAVGDADRTLRQSTKWRGEATTADGEIAELLAPTIAALEQNSATGFDELRRFSDMAARCALLPETLDATALTEHVRAMNELVGGVVADVA